MLRLPQPLRVAARELGRLPEIPEAARLYAARDFAGALRQAERAAEVIGAVPMPAMQLAACGTLAQLLRASGRSAHEAAVWADASNKCASDPTLQTFALHGAAGCHLHLGDGLAAIERFNEAARIIDKERQISGFPLIDPGTPLASSLNGHRTLTRILTLGIVDATIPWLRADNNTAQEDASSGDEMAVAAAAGTKMLLGDALAATGDEDLARECWESLGPPGGGSEADAAADAEPSSDAAAAGAAAGGTQAAENARILREIAAALRLGGSSLRSGDVAAARARFTAAADHCEAHLPYDHPLLPYSLGMLAEAVTAEGEFVAAEGLFRTATDSLLPANADVAMLPPSSVPMLLPTLEAFATLLEQIETNGKPRSAEAEQMRQRAQMVRKAHADALPPVGLELGPACPYVEWLGLEPWYAAGHEVDWLGACVADAD